jgi:hypothetical protein
MDTAASAAVLSGKSSGSIGRGGFVSRRFNPMSVKG